MKYLSLFVLIVVTAAAKAQTIKTNQIVKGDTDSINNSSIKHNEMKDRFFTWQQFANGFGEEMVDASQVYERRKKDGMKDYAFATYDFVFISDSKNKLDSLGSFLAVNYGYKINETQKEDEHWELTGDAT